MNKGSQAPIIYIMHKKALIAATLGLSCSSVLRNLYPACMFSFSVCRNSLYRTSFLLEEFHLGFLMSTMPGKTCSPRSCVILEREELLSSICGLPQKFTTPVCTSCGFHKDSIFSHQWSFIIWTWTIYLLVPWL